MNLTSPLILVLIQFLCFTSFAANESQIAFRGWAINDCVCKSQTFDEDYRPYSVTRGSHVGILCTSEKEQVSCSDGFASRILCPKACIELRPVSKLTRDNRKQQVSKLVSQSAKRVYIERVPKAILKKIENRYPAWLPLVYSNDNSYVANYKLLDNFYFEVPILIRGKKQKVSIVYFFQDFDHLLKSKMNWSFWFTANSELIYDSTVPYPLVDSGYVNHPCPVPAGANLDQIVLYGTSAGESDAGGCCGPYSLQNLSVKGPEEIDRTKPSVVYNEEVIYNTCGRSVDLKTGEYNPKSLLEIDGPANLRKELAVRFTNDSRENSERLAQEKSPVIGECADGSKVVDLGSNGDWHKVYCEGKIGITHRKNLRSPEKLKKN